MYIPQRMPLSLNLSLRIFLNIYLRILKVVKNHMNKSRIKPMLNLKHKNVKKRSSHFVLFKFAVRRKTQMYQNPSQQDPGIKPPHGWVFISASICSNECFCLNIQLFFLPYYHLSAEQLKRFANIQQRQFVPFSCPWCRNAWEDWDITSIQSSMNEVVKYSQNK